MIAKIGMFRLVQQEAEEEQGEEEEEEVDVVGSDVPSMDPHLPGMRDSQPKK